MILEIKVKPGASKDKIPKSQIKILKGKTSKNKLVKVEGLIEEKSLEMIKKFLEKT